MKYSFIVTTMNRPKELKKCIESLLCQTENDFEIIVVDQSDDDLSEKCIREKQRETSCIIYRRVKYKALSKARNDALRLARGDYFALVDDDAVYLPDYLEKCSNIIKKEKKVIISGRIRSNDIEESDFIDYSVANEGERLSFEKVRRICPSAGLVFPISVIKECGLFDENFGLGAYFGAAEETDLLLRALRKKYVVIHTKKAILKHPVQLQMSCEKVLSYARGGGALVKKHLIYFHDFRLLIGGIRLFFAPFIKMLFLFLKKEKRLVEYNRLKGFFDGFIRYKRELLNGIEE